MDEIELFFFCNSLKIKPTVMFSKVISLNDLIKCLPLFGVHYSAVDLERVSFYVNLRGK